eukprot:TRINITY_DN36310_c0_g2_i1.p1 TRINITY_DN36310_c0_g2~~TRINITY_DN36310_c0_g2_i1.p1  ORF type:complete len:2649 (+),score=501.17 TRINITY_DN36310_c0_g2_i1:813-7949(+)
MPVELRPGMMSRLLGRSSDTLPTQGTQQLHSLDKLFPPECKPLVWAAGPYLSFPHAPRVLTTGRTVSKEPQILTEQLRSLAATAASKPANISGDVLQHMRIVFQEVDRLRLTTTVLKPMSSEAFLPCLAESGQGATLFPPKYVALSAHHNHAELSPHIGLLLHDSLIRRVAQELGVPQNPPATILAEVLRRSSGAKAVALAIEVAKRIEAGERRPSDLVVPIASGAVQPVSKVFLDDAPWKRSQSIWTLHPDIGHQDGRRLGCTSVRDELARTMEDDDDEDHFGQEAELVDQVAQLLEEYYGEGDVVSEFVQNTDDYGADGLVFHLSNERFRSERIVDSRAADLQGPALYICSTKELTPAAIKRMQQVGRSDKRLEFSSTGRFGVGLNVMYRWCECPQLYANGKLHFFDLTRQFVARGETARRGKQYVMQKLRENFVDSYEPFKRFVKQYPVVFRLALRTQNSHLGKKAGEAEVLSALKNVGAAADKMLLFTRHLQKIEFRRDGDLLAQHTLEIGDKRSHDNFFARLPDSLDTLRNSQLDRHLSLVKTIRSTQQNSQAVAAQWFVVHRVSNSGNKLQQTMEEIYMQPHGTAVLPWGAAAAKIPSPPAVPPRISDRDTGRICSGLPSLLCTRAQTWVHGSFIWLSSRKSLPLPEAGQAATLHMRWNQQLMEGPVASAVLNVILEMRRHVVSPTWLAWYASLFPLQGALHEGILSRAVFRTSISSEIFPVTQGSKQPVRWTSGPAPTMRTSELTADLQDALCHDGLDLANLPSDLMKDYTSALGRPPVKPTASGLRDFLVRIWNATHGPNQQAEIALKQVALQSLLSEDRIVELLRYMVRDDWRHVVSNGCPSEYRCSFLAGAPLLLTNADTLTRFGVAKFSSHWELLPRSKHLFIKKRVLQEGLMNSVDVTIAGVNQRVRVEPLGLRKLRLEDILPHKAAIESDVQSQQARRGNTFLQQLWAFIADESTPTGWHVSLSSWKILPVHSAQGPALAAVASGHQAVLVEKLDVIAQTKEKLRSALLACGFYLVQSEMLQNAKIAARIQSVAVCHDEDLVRLLVESQRQNTIVEKLNATDRHSFLVYFTQLSLTRGRDISQVRELPLFKTAASSPAFTRLDGAVRYCCLNPGDRHAGALKELMPPGIVLLAWPTADVKPLYDRLQVKVCSGEEFMVQFVIPHLPEICRTDGDGSKSGPYFRELYQFIVVEKSHQVTNAAYQSEFVPAADGVSMRRASTLVDPSRGARHFVNNLAAHLPVGWIQSSETYMTLMRSLGLRDRLPPNLVLLCAEYLDSEASGTVTEGLRRQSADLVEELMLYLSEACPHGSAPPDIIRAAGLRVLVAKSIAADGLEESVRQRDATSSKVDDSYGGRLQLTSMRGAAFGDAKPLLWSVCPVEFHCCHVAGKWQPGKQLEHMLRYYATWFSRQVGAYADATQVDPGLVTKHLAAILKRLPRQGNLAPVRPKHRLHMDLEDCWSRLDSWLHHQKTTASALGELRHEDLPTVPVASMDAADKPAHTVMLAPATVAFKEIPKLGVEALGVKPEPTEKDYAAVTAKLATQAMEAGQPFDYASQVVDECLRGIWHCLRQRDNKSQVSVTGLFMCSLNGDLKPAGELVWADNPAWMQRCEGAEDICFCRQPPGVDYTFMPLLVRTTELRKLTDAVLEQCMHSEGEEHSHRLVQAVEECLRSAPFAKALCALEVQERNKLVWTTTPSKLKTEEVAAALSHVRLVGGPATQSTALYRKQGEVLPGSQKRQPAFYDSRRRVIVVAHHDSLDIPDHSLTRLATTVQIAMRKGEAPLHVFESALRSLLRAHLQGGPLGMARELEEKGVSSSQIVEQVGLSPGDALPDALLEKLVQSMDATFQAGEYIAIYINNAATIAEVLAWGINQPASGTGLQRNYRVRLTGDLIEVRQHFELYKIRWQEVSGSQRPVLTLAALPGSSVHDVAEADLDEAQIIVEIKRQLRQMSTMNEQDYKTTLRRLFKQWHPDKNRNSPFSTAVFRLLRRHEEWYRARARGEAVESEDWLDEFDIGGASRPSTSENNNQSEGTSQPRQASSPAGPAYSHKPAGQASWFEEFERDRREQQQRQQQAAAFRPGGAGPNLWSGVGAPVHFAPRRSMSAAAPQGPTRYIDADEATCWKQQADLEVLAAEKLAEETPAGRALPAATVWHCCQAVEMALKSVMLRTCGITEEELRGKEAHDIALLTRKLLEANAMTAEQQSAQRLPVEQSELAWLGRAYVGARYPRGNRNVPGHMYGPADAQRALMAARLMKRWAADVEDLAAPEGEASSEDEEVVTNQGPAEPAMAPPPAPGPRVQEREALQGAPVPVSLPQPPPRTSQALPPEPPRPQPPPLHFEPLPRGVRRPYELGPGQGSLGAMDN